MTTSKRTGPGSDRPYPTIDLASHRLKQAKWLQLTQELRIPVRKALEAGAGIPGAVETQPFIDRGAKVLLVEPQPDVAEMLRQHYQGQKNVWVEEAALVDVPGLITMRRSLKGPDGCATLDGLKWPTKRVEVLRVKGVRLASLDDGDFDFVHLDMEGAEYFAVKWMVSRPRLLIVENFPRLMVNEYQAEIERTVMGWGYRRLEQFEGDDVWTRS